MADRWLLAGAWAAVGWAAGLLLNRLIHQLPRASSLKASPSCQGCGAAIPILGWPGRPCPACQASLPYDRVEGPTAVLFAALALQWGPGGLLAARSLYALILVAIAVMDLRHRFVYRALAYPALVLALLLGTSLGGLGVPRTVLGLAVGLGVFGAFYLAGRLLYRGLEPMGIGDITIAALIGAMVGFPQVIAALFLGSLVMAGAGGAMLITGRGGRKAYIPYGAGLCLGGLVVLLVDPAHL